MRKRIDLAVHSATNALLAGNARRRGGTEAYGHRMAASI
jgi:hypothetical protein